LMGLPAFGVEKTNWTVGMLGTLDLLPFDGWQEYRVPEGKMRRGAVAPAPDSETPSALE